MAQEVRKLIHTGEVHPIARHEGLALLFLEPRCYMKVGEQRHTPAALPSRQTLYRSVYCLLPTELF